MLKIFNVPSAVKWQVFTKDQKTQENSLIEQKVQLGTDVAIPQQQPAYKQKKPQATFFFSVWMGEDQQKQSSLQGNALHILTLVLQISKALAFLPST